MNHYMKFCTLTTSRILLNFHRSKWSGSPGFLVVFLCAWCCGYPWTVLSLEQGLTILFAMMYAGVRWKTREVVAEDAGKEERSPAFIHSSPVPHPGRVQSWLHRAAARPWCLVATAREMLPGNAGNG